jgi:hypothetical protein
MYWFKWTYFQKRALLFPQRCCQGLGATNAASRWEQLIPAGGSGGNVPRCWVVTDGGDTVMQLVATAVPAFSTAAVRSAAKNRSWIKSLRLLFHFTALPTNSLVFRNSSDETLKFI